jgi:DNA-binding response OmpR family regulator
MRRADQANTKTALVVNDDPWVRVVLRAMLAEAGYLVSLASNGFSGLRLARQVLPHLVLLDLSLPEVPGGVVLRELRQDPATCQATVALMQPALDATTLVDLLEADGFLQTPVVPAELLAELRQATARREAPLTAARTLASPPPVRLAGGHARDHIVDDMLAPVLLSH